MNLNTKCAARLLPFLMVVGTACSSATSQVNGCTDPVFEGVFQLNQLCSTGFDRWDFMVDNAWDGKWHDETAVTPSPSYGGHQRFGQSVSMGDFDGDGYVDLLVSAPNASRTIETFGATPDYQTTMGLSGTYKSRSHAGRVYLIYGPWGGGTNPWHDRPGFASKNAQNWDDFPDSVSNRDGSAGADGYSDTFEWFNTFDLNGEPRYEDSSEPDDNDHGDSTRIPGIIFQGSYGRYYVDGNAWCTQVLEPVHHKSMGVETGTTDSYAAVYATESTDIHFPSTPPSPACPGTYGIIDSGSVDYERMGTVARFIGDVNGDGCDDILIGAPEYDEYDVLTGEGVVHVDDDPATTGVDETAKHRLLPMNNGRVYLIFGQGAGNEIERYEGNFDLAGGPKYDNDIDIDVDYNGSTFNNPDSNQVTPTFLSQLNRDTDGDGFPNADSLQGVTFKAPYHSLMGRDLAPLPAVFKTVNGVAAWRSFNGDAIDDFMVALGSYDTNLNQKFGVASHNGSNNGWDPRCQDPDGRETGFGAVAILYGKAHPDYEAQRDHSNFDETDPDHPDAPVLNPWADTEYLLPDTLDERDAGTGSPISTKPNGVYFVGGRAFQYVSYCGPAGDFTGDGYPDALIGQPYFDGDVGKVFLVPSQGAAFPESPHVSQSPPSPAAFLLQHDEYDFASGSDPYVSPYWVGMTAGPATLDDYHQTPDTTNTSAPWIPGSTQDVVLTGQNPGGTISGVDPASPTVFNASSGTFPQVGLRLGWSVWTAGDVDNDGNDDILLGAPHEGSILQGDATAHWATGGRTYLVYGYSATAGTTIDLDAAASSSSPTTVAVFRGELNGDHAGYAVMDAGDYNSDGIDDFLISAPWADHPDVPGGHCHSDCLFPGGSCESLPGHNVISGDVHDEAELNGGYINLGGNSSFNLNDDFRGYVGDENGRHLDLGAVYMVYGKSTRFSGNVELADVGGAVAGLSLWGLTGHGIDDLDPDTGTGDSDDYVEFLAPEFGWSLAGSGHDLDHDGTDDFVIGVPVLPTPTSAFEFPAKINGGVATVFGYYGVLCSESPPIGLTHVREYLEAVLRGDADDLNQDGVVDLFDILKLIE